MTAFLSLRWIPGSGQGQSWTVKKWVDRSWLGQRKRPRQSVIQNSSNERCHFQSSLSSSWIRSLPRCTSMVSIRRRWDSPCWFNLRVISSEWGGISLWLEDWNKRRRSKLKQSGAAPALSQECVYIPRVLFTHLLISSDGLWARQR